MQMKSNLNLLHKRQNLHFLTTNQLNETSDQLSHTAQANFKCRAVREGKLVPIPKPALNDTPPSLVDTYKHINHQNHNHTHISNTKLQIRMWSIPDCAWRKGKRRRRKRRWRRRPLRCRSENESDERKERRARSACVMKMKRGFI